MCSRYREAAESVSVAARLPLDVDDDDVDSVVSASTASQVRTRLVEEEFKDSFGPIGSFFSSVIIFYLATF